MGRIHVVVAPTVRNMFREQSILSQNCYGFGRFHHQKSRYAYNRKISSLFKILIGDERDQGVPGPWESDRNILASFWSHPKSFRIWSFQTGVELGFQGFLLKLSHLGEIVVQSWKFC